MDRTWIDPDGGVHLSTSDRQYLEGGLMKVKLLHKDAKVPTRAHDDDAGYDLYAIEDTYVYPGEIHKMPIGISLEIPFMTVGEIVHRSSTFACNCSVLGHVDGGYRGEIIVAMQNHSPHSVYKVRKGDRLAQLILKSIRTPTVELVTNLDDTVRGEGGFGSTGV